MATATSPSRGLTSSRASEPAELDDFAGFCAELTLDNGRPFVLEDFQRRILADYFAGTTETLILLPKKNGKSTLMAALALYHLVVTNDAECYIAASSREQAGIILKQARKFIGKNADLGRLMRMNQRAVESNEDEGFVRVLASDEDTADGVIPTLAIVDELHRHKSANLYGVFRDGLGGRSGRMITISTAGDDTESPLGQMRVAAEALPTQAREDHYRYSRDFDGDYVMHEWALDLEEDREDLALVKRANPASFMTVAILRRRQKSPSMTPWQWARFACGVWLQGENSAINPIEWKACETDENPPEGLTWRIGLDVGWKDDFTAAVPHAIDDTNMAWLGRPRILRAEREGISLRKEKVIQALTELREECGASVIVMDPENDGEVLGQDLEDLGFDVIAHSQKPQPMATAAERFHAAVRERKLCQPGDRELTWHVLNAVAKSTEDGRWRFVKDKKDSPKKIDALIAAAMVHSIASTFTASEPMFAFG